jgi:hypothetical protein
MAEVIVTTPAELVAAGVNAAAGPITLNAASFLLTANFVIDHACVVQPHSSQAGITIDGNDTYQTKITADGVFLVASSSKQITFTQGSDGVGSVGASCYVFQNAVSGLMQVEFEFCNFTEGYNFGATKFDGSGLLAFNASSTNELRVIARNCKFNDNDQDGASCKATGDSSAIIQVYLIDCELDNNGNNPGYVGAGGEGDGATTHFAHNMIIMSGCTVTDNKKSGIAISDGTAAIDDCTFARNGTTNSQGSIICDNNGAAIVTNSTFTETNTGSCDVFVTSTCGGMTISGCVFRDTTNVAEASIRISTGKGIFIFNNVFYNLQTKAIYSSDRNYVAYNNIFEKCGNRGFSHDGGIVNIGVAGVYAGDNPLNGYNCFYDNAHDVVTSSDNPAYSGSLAATDIQENPLMVDPANADFRLEPGSPALNSGRRILNDGYKSIGAWQQKQRGSMIGAF